MPDITTMTLLIIAAGVAQFAIAAASLGLPRVLRWREDLAKLRPLNRHIFWVYSAYIFGTNIAIAALSAFAPVCLLDDSILAIAVTGYIALYWSARFVIQLFGYRGEDVPKGTRYRIADVVFAIVFAYLGGIYSLILLSNIRMVDQ